MYVRNVERGATPKFQSTQNLSQGVWVTNGVNQTQRADATRWRSPKAANLFRLRPLLPDEPEDLGGLPV